MQTFVQLRIWYYNFVFTFLILQVVTDLDGNYITQIGSSGEEGLRDGSFDNATFNRPQVNIRYFWMGTILSLLDS